MGIDTNYISPKYICDKCGETCYLGIRHECDKGKLEMIALRRHEEQLCPKPADMSLEAYRTMIDELVYLRKEAPMDASCGYGCGFREPYRFVVMAGCPVHDAPMGTRQHL